MSAPANGLTLLTNAAVAASRTVSGSRRSHAFAASLSACLETALRQRRIECNETNPFLNLPDAILATLINEATRVNLSRVCQRLRRLVCEVPEVYETIALDPEPRYRSRPGASPQRLTAMVQLTPHAPVQYLSIRLAGSMSDTWFEGVCHLLEATLGRVQDLDLVLPSTFDSPAFMRAMKGPAQLLVRLSLEAAPPYLPSSDPDRPWIRGTAWDFERFFVDGAPRLAHCVSEVDIFQAPSNKLSNLRTLVIGRIPRFNRAKDLDDLLAFLPNLEELSVRLYEVRRLQHLREELLAPCAFVTVHRKLRHLRVERLRGSAYSLVTLCAVLGCVQIVAIEPVLLSGLWPCSDIGSALPIISSISVGSALCEYVSRRTIEDKPIRVLRAMLGQFGRRNLRDVLDMPTFPHLTTLSFHEFFWPNGSDTPLPALPNLSRLRIMLASCREYGITVSTDGHFPVDPAPPSILHTCIAEWDLPALRMMHLSFFPNTPCYYTSRADCTCLRPTRSVALSDVCSFASAPMRWSGGKCEALRLSGVSIVDFGAEKYISTLYTLFQDITITEQYEPESCDASAEVWKGSPLSIFQNPLIVNI